MIPRALSCFLCALAVSLSAIAGGPDSAASEAHRASYSKDYKIHVGVLGVTDGEPLTQGDDFKPVWSKTGGKILFFHRVVNDPEVGNWKTAVCIMNVDGSGLEQITSGEFTDFNHTWTRDGSNTPIWNRKHAKGGGYSIYASKIGGKPGEEYPLTDSRHHAWAYSTLMDGRIFVGATPIGMKRGYFLMTPSPDGKPTPTYERVNVPADLFNSGILDRVSISPSEDRICFEYQKGFKYTFPGRTLYVGDFDKEKRTITNLKAFANEEGKNVWFAYPRFTKDESAIMYHAGGKLFLYDLANGTTKKVSVDDKAYYIYPHGEASPK